MTEPTNDLIRDVLTKTRTIAVLGASPDPSRASHDVMRYLIEHGYEVFPVNPLAHADEILGRKVYERLSDVPGRIDMVDVFRRSELAGEACDQAIEAGASAVWMQLGVINEDGAERARRAGLKVIMDRCPKIEMPRLGITRPT